MRCGTKCKDIHLCVVWVFCRWLLSMSHFEKFTAHKLSSKVLKSTLNSDTSGFQNQAVTMKNWMLKHWQSVQRERRQVSGNALAQAVSKQIGSFYWGNSEMFYPTLWWIQIWAVCLHCPMLNLSIFDLQYHNLQLFQFKKIRTYVWIKVWGSSLLSFFLLSVCQLLLCSTFTLFQKL